MLSNFKSLAIIASLIIATFAFPSVAYSSIDYSRKGAESTFKTTSKGTVSFRYSGSKQLKYTRQNSGTTYPSIAKVNSELPKIYSDNCHVTPGKVVMPNRKAVCDSYGVRTSSRKVVLMGDSKMGQWFTPIETIAKRENWRLMAYTKSSCAFSLTEVKPDCAKYNKKLYSKIVNQIKPKMIIYSQVSSVSTGVTKYLKKLENQGIKIVIIKDNPVPAGFEMLGCLKNNLTSYLKCSYPFHQAYNRSHLYKVHNSLSKSTWITLDSYICPGRVNCTGIVGKTPVFRQGSHISNAYAKSMTNIIHSSFYTKKVSSKKPPVS